MDKENYGFYIIYIHVITSVNKVFCFSDVDNSSLLKTEPSLSKPVTETPPSSDPCQGAAQSTVAEKEGMTDMLLVSHTLVAESLPSVVAGKVVLISQNCCNTFLRLCWNNGGSNLKNPFIPLFSLSSLSFLLSSHCSKNYFQDP